MIKIARIGLILGLLLTTLTLTACGSQPTADITPYQTAKPFQPDQKTLDSFKESVKGIKAATLTTYSVTGTPADIKTYYDNEFQKAGWKSHETEIADVTRQQVSQNGWSIAYEKGPNIATLTLTPGSLAATNFPSVASTDNLLVMISASK